MNRKVKIFFSLPPQKIKNYNFQVGEVKKNFTSLTKKSFQVGEVDQKKFLVGEVKKNLLLLIHFHFPHKKIIFSHSPPKKITKLLPQIYFFTSPTLCSTSPPKNAFFKKKLWGRQSTFWYSFSSMRSGETSSTSPIIFFIQRQKILPHQKIFFYPLILLFFTSSPKKLVDPLPPPPKH